jgi:uncharacterized hydrophobic protein (TIGR00271 family)
MAAKNSFLNLRSLYTYLKYKLRLSRDKSDMATTIESVRSGANMTGANLWVLVLAIFTASLGLNVNSTAVIIGAMLISPLMGPIIAIGMGVAIHDFALVYRALKNFGLAVCLSILTSTLYFLISPLKVPGSELLARTSPTIYDVLIAIVGGLAGIVAGSSKLRQSNVVPGVAIATALMPPLCTAGFGIANLNGHYLLGAFYLFFINTVFICLATYFIVRLLKYPVVDTILRYKSFQIKSVIGLVVIGTLIPSIWLTFGIVRKYIFEEKAKQFVKQTFKENNRIVLKSEALYLANKPVVRLSMLGAEIDSAEQAVLRAKMKDFGLDNVKLEIQQGLSQDSKGAALIGSISQSVEANSEAVGQLFNELDLLKNQALANQLTDSLQKKLGKQVKDSLPDLRIFRLSRISYFDAGKSAEMVGWEATCLFARKQRVTDLNLLKQRLKLQLPGDTLVFNVIR